jgi:hypothetical protein
MHRSSVIEAHSLFGSVYICPFVVTNENFPGYVIAPFYQEKIAPFRTSFHVSYMSGIASCL